MWISFVGSVGWFMEVFLERGIEVFFLGLVFDMNR